MLELALAWTGGLLIGAAGIMGYALRHGVEEKPTGLTFEDVCHAAARAKEDRRQEGALSTDYVDGADGVMAELMADMDLTHEEMQAAYRAGGEEVEIES